VGTLVVMGADLAEKVVATNMVWWQWWRHKVMDVGEGKGIVKNVFLFSKAENSFPPFLGIFGQLWKMFFVG
jgi:hypothetical protein